MKGVKVREKKKLVKMEDITEEIRKTIQFEKRGVGLEDGDFYDGSCFRDNCGNVLQCHPSNYLLKKKVK